MSVNNGMGYNENYISDITFLHANTMSNLYEHLLVFNHYSDDQDGERDEGGVAVAPAKPKLKKPSMYKVVLLNDDYTPMDFVVEVLERFFSMPTEKATQVMIAVHVHGKGVCGLYTKDIAETKAAMVNQYSRDNEHPLLCDIEAVDE